MSGKTLSMADGENMLAFNYHKAAKFFLKLYYIQNAENSILFRYHFSGQLAKEGKRIARSIGLEELDYQDALVATWFSYAGPAEIIMPSAVHRMKLLHEYFEETDYPPTHRTVVENAIAVVTSGKISTTPVQQVVFDAVYSQLGLSHFIENIYLLKNEINRLFLLERSELSYLKYYRELSKKTNYYTVYAYEHYSTLRVENCRSIEDGIAVLEAVVNY